MQKTSSEVASPSADSPPPLPVLSEFNSRPAKTLTKFLLVEFRNGEAVVRHPELRTYLEDGWQIRSAVPRIVESQGTKLLVVLVKAETPAHLKRIK